MSVESRISNLEKAAADLTAQRQDTGQDCLAGWPGPSEPVPELPADATTRQRRLHAEVKAMYASIPRP